MDAYIGEIRAFPYTYVPQVWLRCDGSIQQVYSYQALYSLIGNTFGGNGTQTFGLPNLQGVAAMGAGTGPGLTPRPWSSHGGTATVTLNNSELPSHTHTLHVHRAKPTTATSPLSDIALTTPVANSSYLGVPQVQDPTPPQNAVLAYVKLVSGTSPNTYLAQQIIGAAGQNQAHENRQPYLALELCICWQGEYPLRN